MTDQCNISTLNNFNSFIQQATQTIVCGPECQKDNKTQQLYQKYLASKENLLTAPSQIQSATKNYIVFTEGEASYDEFHKSQLNNQARKITNSYKRNFNQTINKINTEIDTREGLLLNLLNVMDLLKKYHRENNILNIKLRKTSNDILTNQRKSYYQNDGIEILYSYFFWLIVIYIFIFVIFIIFNLVFQTKIDFKYRIVITILLIIYPFISFYLLQFIIYLYNLIISILPKNVHNEI
jgi:hypothetical protein